MFRISTKQMSLMWTKKYGDSYKIMNCACTFSGLDYPLANSHYGYVLWLRSSNNLIFLSPKPYFLRKPTLFPLIKDICTQLTRV